METLDKFITSEAGEAFVFLSPALAFILIILIFYIVETKL